MKDNFIHVCFVIDESGSMTGTEADVVGGFRKVIDEQKANSAGTCSVSYYTFDSKVKQLYLGKDISDVEYIDDKYSPGGCTALYDAVGTAIDEVGKWLDGMKEEEKPEKNLIVIMTDGGENSSVEYSSSKVREMIKHQEEKYNWTFIYMGSDLTDARDANVLGVSTRLYASKANYASNYDAINCVVTSYRGMKGDAGEKGLALNEQLFDIATAATEEYATEIGIDAGVLLDNKDTQQA